MEFERMEFEWAELERLRGSLSIVEPEIPILVSEMMQIW